MEDNFILFVFVTSVISLLFISAWNFITYIQHKYSKKNSWSRQIGMEANGKAQIQFYKGSEDVE